LRRLQAPLWPLPRGTSANAVQNPVAPERFVNAPRVSL